MTLDSLEKRKVWLQFASAALTGCAARTSPEGMFYERDDRLVSDAADLADLMLAEYEERVKP